ncbi:MAG: TatD family deoxyribonuclease [Alphaproteobacteria bacterium]|nr:MAG: TatD family deoxyribonuclease [Alphaproteobacteria bacterium]
MLVDSHCHLDFKDFDGELDDIVARAGAAGVGTLVTISTRRSTFERVLGVAERFDNMYCTVGIHPHEADAEGETPAEELIKLAQHPKVIGIGETGLDYYYDHSDREKQRQSFRRHIAAARETGLPLIVHTRDAEEDTIAILHDEWERGPFPGLIHCFTSTEELAKAALKIGLSISVSGIVTFKSAQELRDTISNVPLERLLVETDAPYLAPVPRRGKRNEPSFVRHTAEFLAELKGVSFEALAEATTDNFFSLFSKAERPG